MNLGPRKVFITALLACGIGLCVRPALADETAALPDTIRPLALDHIGLRSLRTEQPALTGAGTKIAVICRSFTYVDDLPQNDYRPDTAHNCLRATAFGFHDRNPAAAGLSPHSTAVCSILFGSDDNAYHPLLGAFRYEGIVPDADAEIYEFWHFLINNVYAGLPPDVDLISTSLGDEHQWWWTRGIQAMAEQFGIVVVAAIGNGLNAHEAVLYPAAGTNTIGVGVVDTANSEKLAVTLAALALAYPQHSSTGPATDGRSKPDIVAPGNCLVARPGEPNRYEPAGNWSSFATPLVAGTAAVLIQKAKQDPNLALAVSPIGGNCVIKALLMNSATKLPFWHKGRLGPDDDHLVPLDYLQGAGMLNALQAYRLLTAGRNKPGRVAATGWDLSVADTSENGEKRYRFSLQEPAGKVVTATLVWNRHYQSCYPFKRLAEEDVDLRLELWAVDPNNPAADYLLDYSDSAVDNVEHIYHPADPNYEYYELVVACNDAGDPNQPDRARHYALAWSAAEPPGNDDDIRLYDLNADGVVNEDDVTILLGNALDYVQTPDRYLLGDIDESGAIDFDDIQLLMDNLDLKAQWYER